MLARKNNKGKKEIKYLKIFKNKGVIALTSVLVFVLSLGIISFVTKTNVVTYITNRILKELGIYTEEIRNIEIESSDYSSNVGGSWHINKSAKWTGLGKAQVTFDVNSVMKTEGNYKDVVLVLDISGSMYGEKLEKAKSDSKELISYLLSNPHNRVAIITFDSTSEIVSMFSNDKNNLIAKIDTLTERGETNYNAALLNVDVVMKGYIKETNRDVVTLFLTDGYPNEDIPNQIGTFEVLKDKYPYMSINGIQYEMGHEIIEEIKQITDSAWVADQLTLNNVLFDASVSPFIYEKFIVTDYIDNDYFTINSVDDIKVSKGTVTLDVEDGVQKITWNLGDNSFMTGGNAKMTINLTMKEGYVGSEGYYPTNKKEKIESKLPEETIKTVNSSNTPVLKNNYEVIYDPNTPDGCTIESIPTEKYFVYENVTKKRTELSCNGYLFKGWEIDGNDSKDIKRINDNVFVMPWHDVTIRAIWTRPSISKSIDGTVHTSPVLYNVVRNDAEKNRGAVLYTGNGSDKFAKKVYYYNGDANTTNNNVLFANFCWKIVRTTETGGVKLVYNGIPNGSNKLIEGSEYTNLTNDEIYPYEFDSVNKKWKNDKVKNGDTGTISFSVTTPADYVVNYKASEGNDGDAKLYVYKDGEIYDTLTLSEYGGGRGSVNLGNLNDTNSTYEIKIEYTNNCSDGPDGPDGPDIPGVPTDPTDPSVPVNIESRIANTCSDSFEFSIGVRISSKSTCAGVYSEIGSSPFNIKDGSIAYAGYMYNPTSASNYSYNEMRFSSTSTGNYKYGTSFTYADGKYKLNEENIIEFRDWEANYNRLNNNHYTCFNETGECTTLSYIYHTYNNGTYDSGAYYINLTGGKSVEDALKEMLWNDDVNVKDSTIKTYIDAWYRENMTDYTNKLEDTVFCNDRSIYHLNGFNPNGGDTTKSLNFAAYERDPVSQNDLTCTNKNDSFTTDVSNGNGKLTYPVGLLTKDEVGLAGSSQMKTGNYYWLGSPHGFGMDVGEHTVVIDGSLSDSVVHHPTNGIRPAVSLKPDTFYSSGDGSSENPYVVN